MLYPGTADEMRSSACWSRLVSLSGYEKKKVIDVVACGDRRVPSREFRLHNRPAPYWT